MSITTFHGIRLLQPCVSVLQTCLNYPFCDAAKTTPGNDDDAPECAGDWTAGAVWRGGEQLAEWLFSMPEAVAGKRVLELGSGTGIAGLAAVLAGAAFVTLTDRHVEQATANVRLNPSLAAHVRVRSLQWGATSADDEAVDLVLGADLVYPVGEAALDLLLGTLATLRRPTLLAYVERSSNTTANLLSGLERLGARCHWQRGFAAGQAGSKASLIALDAWTSDVSAHGCEIVGYISASGLRAR